MVAAAWDLMPGIVWGADVIVLPGTKQTLDDLQWIRDRGFERFFNTYEGFVVGRIQFEALVS